MNKVALVTGGAGFIGSHLVDKLINDGWRIRVVDNLSSGRLENLIHHKNNPNLEILICDLKETECCLKALHGVNVVFHFAANPEVRVSTTHPEIHFKENIMATFNLLEAMRKRDVKELVFASSSSVYGEAHDIPVNERAPIKPVSVYGASKASCENLIHAYSKLYGIKAIILRYANVIGPRLRHGVIYDLLMKIKHNPRILEVLGDGTQTRSYIYISDAIEATMIAYYKTVSNYEVYNVGSCNWITVKDVVQIILDELKLTNIKVIYKPILHGIGWPGDVKKIALDITKLKKLGFKPMYRSEEAIANTVKALKSELSVLI